MAVDTALRTGRTTRLLPYAGAGLAAALCIVVLGNVNVQAGENGGTGPGIFTGIVCTLVTVVLFAGVLPRVRRTERVAVIAGAIGVASIVVFWSGLTPVLAAVAAAALARAERPGCAARVLTVLAVVAAVFALGVTLIGSHLF